MELKINWDRKRTRNAIERMWLRGVSMKNIREAIQRGQKKKQRKSKLIEAFYSYYSVVYAEYVFPKKKLQKVYPVTVKVW